MGAAWGQQLGCAPALSSHGCGVGSSTERGCPGPQPSPLQLALSRNKFIPACPMWKRVRNTRQILISGTSGPLLGSVAWTLGGNIWRRKGRRDSCGTQDSGSTNQNLPEPGPCHLCCLLQSLEMTVTACNPAAWRTEDHHPRHTHTFLRKRTLEDEDFEMRS